MGEENKISYRMICRIEDALDQTPLASTNFNIVTSDEFVVNITSKILPDYSFRMRRDGNFSCEVRPGDVDFVDRPGFSSVPDAVPRMKKWAEDVADDLRIRQERIEKDRLINAWEKLVQAKYGNPEEPLDFADYENWKKIVEDLQARVAELEKKGVISQEQAESIITEGEIVEKQSASMPGSAWMRKAGKYLVWVLKYVSQDPEVRHFLITHIQNAVKELPSHIETAKNILDSIPQ